MDEWDDEEDIFEEGLYVHGTRKLKPEIIGIFVVAGFVVAIAVLVGLFRLGEYVVAYVKWRCSRRRIRIRIHRVRDISANKACSSAANANQVLERDVNDNILQTRDRNNNDNVPDVDTQELTEILLPDASEVEAKKLPPWILKNDSFQSTDSNSNPVNREIRLQVVCDDDAVSQDLDNIVVMNCERTNPDLQQEFPTTTPPNPIDTNSSQLPKPELIAEQSQNEPGPSFFHQLTNLATQDLLEYSQAEGGWQRQKIEKYASPRKEQNTNVPDPAQFASIPEPIANFETQAISPDPTEVELEIEDIPARFEEHEYSDTDAFQIEGKIERITGTKSTGIISMLDFMQAEGSPHSQNTTSQPMTSNNPFLQPIQWSNRPSRVSSETESDYGYHEYEEEEPIHSATFNPFAELNKELRNTTVDSEASIAENETEINEARTLNTVRPMTAILPDVDSIV